MASSSSGSVPAYPSQSWKYHVFLSFRGEDTRNTFVGYLYSALEQKGIYTYKDDKKLPQGELIGPSLMKAIRESQIAVIVFSENYADSSWCLEELAYIMNCRETRGQIVIPLFYDVEPSELRKQKQKYGEAFLKHELENKTKVESWRKALVDASNLSGWDIANRHESEFIKEIVSKISKMLHPLTSRVNDNLVGIEARVQDLKSRLKVGSSGVLKIGIWGVGGAGKTTLASYFYDEMSREFNGCCFVENIREESSKYGLKKLQEEILSSILKHNEVLGGVKEEMGHHIVRGEHPDNPEKHSRIWKEEDVVNICAMDATTELDMIEAIRFKHNSVDHIQRYKHLHPFVANTKNLRWIEWQGDLASPLLTNFPQRKLCCLILHNSSRTQLWEGYKILPNLKIMELCYMSFLMITPNFNGLPHLERFKLTGCRLLEEIHPSIGRLERLVFLSIEDCRRLKMFPPITQLKKLKTLSFSGCYKLFKLSEIQQNMDNLHLYNSGDTKLGLQLFCDLEELVLRKLDLSWCCLEDDDMSYALWELPNLQELNLEGNKFSQLSFTRLQLPRLKRLDVSWCRNLVKLSALPSSIAIVKADHCRSLRSFGDVSNCKWLWNFSHRWESKLGEAGIILNSMLQGNAVEDHFISVAFERQIPKGFVGRFFTGYSFTRRRPHDANDSEDTFTLRLPDDWTLMKHRGLNI
ncbi:unnamed protein product [Lactuca saligna]|uniref:TIR domain-containing protein n=1 Tax=Lactuca saligna TaxID=75948 RepID=A0AA35ZSI2_LACSI|nr:unnamed protein product [Lactuca saligna]